MGESRVSLRVIAGSLRKFWWIIVAGALIGGIGSFGYASLQTPLFQATTSLYFALNQGTSASDLNQGSAYTQSQMLSFAQLATSSRVLDPVIEELDLDVTPRELTRSIEVSIPQSTVTLRITGIADDKDAAADLANAVAGQLILVVKDVAPKDPQGESTISAEIIDDAVAPEFQFTPSKPRDALLGAFLGGVLGLAVAVLIGVLDTRVRNEETLAQSGGDPVLGVVSKDTLLATRGIAVAQEPLGHTSEEFRRIRSALAYANVTSQVKVLLVTSGSPGEGKSTVSVNLAMTLAGLRNSVLLIDADMRRPRAHEHAGIDGSIGLTSVLLDEVDFEVAKHSVADSTLDILPAGTVPPNPAELLTSSRMTQLLDFAATEYDYVVIDSPPTLSVADANLFATQTDGVILVVDATKTGRAALAKSIKSLESGGARILGTVLNRARPDRHRSEYYSD
ncbi:polysaccharide biosynthesis tyrosine autokinase [Microbacterium sp. LWO14-1.2]|jgi:capsular exopolysaccharide synthesis family protein|uniref:polysaccharide biosynthesis tyrosine autokinase n=1 Tax=Microbacterium sp. LWO14-1.2 TaxID=3135263 RepID=UPI003139F338